MIIGNNNKNNLNGNQQNFTSNFNERFNTIVNEAEKSKNNMPYFAEDTHKKHYSDVNSKKEMSDKSFAMLQERLNNGVITLEEFNRKCNKLNKLRQK